ncbi:MAG: hypothetical protein K9I37_04860 [Crocinitomicaceae bacterium]|nr:hypothetical protein [Crocinitomicaceae bacterium]
MLKIVTIFSFSLFFTPLFSQQIGNGDLEQWENVAAPTEEPVNWNSFKTGSGNFAGFANKQIERSANVRAGASGMYSARIWSTSVLGIVANGTMTCGRINMGSTTPANAANYNYSSTADANFSETCTGAPDSIVFWVKYTQAGGGTQEARMKASIHDAFDVRDPEDANSMPHIVASAQLNYPQTGGAWVRKSVPFVYSGPATTPAFILVTFATNATPGGGAANDEVLIDDVSLIYNSGANLNENKNADLRANYSDITGIHFFSNEAINGNLLVFNSLGAQEFKGEMTEYTKVKLSSGVHFAKYQLVSGKSGTIKFLVD